MNAGLLCLGYDQHLLTTMLAHVAALRVPAACMAVYQSAPCIAKWGRDIEMEHQVGSGHSLCCSTQASSASSLVFNGLLGESTADANTGSALRGSPFDAGCLDIKQASAGAYASAASVNETYAEAAPRHLASAACGGTRGPAPRCGGGTGLWWRGPGRGTCPAARRAGRQAPSRAAHRAADR